MKSTEANGSSGHDVAQDTERNETKRTWEPMKLTYAGEAKDIVRSGGGKIGITQADMGDTNKPQGKT